MVRVIMHLLLSTNNFNENTANINGGVYYEMQKGNLYYEFD